MLLGGVLCLGGWQVWLTLRLLEQDRHLELQRSHERLNQIADLALAQVTGNLKDWELGVQALNDLPAPVLQARFPKGATFITVSEREIKIYPKRSLLFTPSFQTPLVQEPGAFNGVDELEFREQQYDRAMALLTPLATRLATRAEALLRLARIEYKAKRPEAALDTYAKLITENAVTQSGTPYALSAISARCRILIALGRKEEAQSEASRLHAGLLDGRWPISRDVFELHWASLNSLGLNVRTTTPSLRRFLDSRFRTFQPWSTRSVSRVKHNWPGIPA